jgi:hypothetical protein
MLLYCGAGLTTDAYYMIPNPNAVYEVYMWWAGHGGQPSLSAYGMDVWNVLCGVFRLPNSPIHPRQYLGNNYAESDFDGHLPINLGMKELFVKFPKFTTSRYIEVAYVELEPICKL